MDDYGVLTGLVDDIGALVAAGAAIMLGFKGRQRWEPSEEDIPKGPVKVAGTLTVIGVGLLYFASKTNYNENFYFWFSIACGFLLLFGFLVYVILITVYTYNRQIASGTGIITEKVIGGFTLTHDAKTNLHNAKTIQSLLRGAAYDVDLVWPRASRALAKICFLLSYFIIILGGCLALAAVAIMLNNLEIA